MGLFRTASSGTFLQHPATMLTGQQERFSQGDREEGTSFPPLPPVGSKTQKNNQSTQLQAFLNMSRNEFYIQAGALLAETYPSPSKCMLVSLHSGSTIPMEQSLLQITEISQHFNNYNHQMKESTAAEGSDYLSLSVKSIPRTMFSSVS